MFFKCWMTVRRHNISSYWISNFFIFCSSNWLDDIFLLKNLKQHFSLFRTIANDHRTDRIITKFDTALRKVFHDIIQHGFNKFLVCVEVAFFCIPPQYFDVFQHLFELHFIFGFYAFSNQFQGITIRNRRIVIVFVDITTKSVFRFSIITNQRRTCQTNQNSVRVRCKKICQKTTTWIVTPMHFI